MLLQIRPTGPPPGTTASTYTIDLRENRRQDTRPKRTRRSENVMAARSIASLLVSFGMVSIPVKLYAATQATAGISFNLLHRACGSRLRQQYM
jgi:3-polyprenyl-4-hydroxybenzoate decarboxylase